MAEEKKDEFMLQKHLRYLKHNFNMLPAPYASQDCNRLTLIYFVAGGLDLFRNLEDSQKKLLVDFHYAMQVLPDKNGKYNMNCGFRGGSFFGRKYDSSCDATNFEGHIHDQAHIAMTYTSLCVLIMCGDDLSRVHKGAIIEALKSLQREDGSFSPVAGGSENDMRFVFCAAAISKILNDWSGIDIDRAVRYILSSQSFDGSIGQGPGQEGHGGSTYCAIAALYLMNRLDDLPRKDQLIQWCVERQLSGFQGRINKPADTCYAFWIGSTLKMLKSFELIDYAALKGFLLNCQTPHGGFSKQPGFYPDVLHTYMSLCGLSFISEYDLPDVVCSIGISRRHLANFSHLQDLI